MTDFIYGYTIVCIACTLIFAAGMSIAEFRGKRRGK